MKRVWVLAFVVILGGVFFQTANADTFHFGDNAYFWGDTGAPGGSDNTTGDSWANGQPEADYGGGLVVHDDLQDEIGTPAIPEVSYGMGGGTIDVVTVDGKTYLQQVSINYVNGDDSEFNDLLKVGDLFVDDHMQNGGATWEWVAEGMETDATVGVHDYTDSPIALGNQAETSDAGYVPVYEMSGQDGTGTWDGIDIRDDHPVSLVSYNTATASADFSGWTTDVGDHTLTWDFTSGGSNGLLLSAIDGLFDLGLGFTVSCANDVLFETVSATTTQGIPVPTPEPATLLLFVSGLAGLGVKRARRSS